MGLILAVVLLFHRELFLITENKMSYPNIPRSLDGLGKTQKQANMREC